MKTILHIGAVAALLALGGCIVAPPASYYGPHWHRCCIYRPHVWVYGSRR